MTTLKDKLDTDHEMFARANPTRAAELALGKHFASGYADGQAAIAACPDSTAADTTVVLGVLTALIDHLGVEGQMWMIDTLDVFIAKARAHVMEAGAVKYLGEDVRAVIDQMNAGDAGAALSVAERLVRRLREEGHDAEADAGQALIDETARTMAARQEEARADHNTPDA